MKIVRPALDREADNTPSRASELRRVRRRIHLELLHRIQLRHRRHLIVIGARVRRAVDQNFARRPAPAVHAKVVRRRLARRVVPSQPPHRYPRNIGQQQIRVAHIQRNRHQELVLHHRAPIRPARRNQWRRVGNRDRFPHLTRRQLQAYRARLPNLQSKPVNARLFEPHRTGRDVIYARLHRRQHVIAFIVARRRRSHTSGAIGQLHPHTRNHRARRVGNTSGHHRILSERRGRREQ